MIKSTPLSFVIALLVSSLLIIMGVWQVFSWRYGGIIESKDERIAKLKEGADQGTWPRQKVTRENVGNTPIEVLSRAGRVLGGTVFNATAGQGYLVFFDVTAESVTLGQTPPTYWVPAAPGDSRPVITADEEISFDTAITIACVTAPRGTAASLCNVAFIVQPQ